MPFYALAFFPSLLIIVYNYVLFYLKNFHLNELKLNCQKCRSVKAVAPNKNKKVFYAPLRWCNCVKPLPYRANMHVHRVEISAAHAPPSFIMVFSFLCSSLGRKIGSSFFILKTTKLSKLNWDIRLKVAISSAKFAIKLKLIFGLPD